MNDFSIVVGIKGTEREKKFIKESINSAIDLNPGEIIFGIDDPSDIGKIITDICLAREFNNYRIIKVKTDPKWKFQLANVIWTCYGLSKYDKIICFDIDSPLLKDIMIGYDIIGKDNIAMCGFTKKLLVNSFFSWIRFRSYRKYVKANNFNFAGIYWIFKPYYFELVNKEEYQKIKNGVDTFLLEKIQNQNKYKIITRKEMACYCLDIQNNDYPWRQFQDGIWLYAHRDEKLVVKQHPKFLVLCTYALKFGWLDMIFGYLWAWRHKNHIVVQKAMKMTLEEFGYVGSELIKMTGKKFKRDDGTGF